MEFNGRGIQQLGKCARIQEQNDEVQIELVEFVSNHMWLHYFKFQINAIDVVGSMYVVGIKIG
ncbi:unnamed protein product [Prunus armeniaca]